MTDGLQQMFAYGTATPPHCRDREETGVIRPGAHVRIVGLESRSDLNGTNGVVLDYSYQKARWAVQTEREAVWVKPANLRVDYKQPPGVPTAKSYLEKITPPGMQFAPQMPPFCFGADFQIEKPDLEAEARSARMQVLKCGLHAAGAHLSGGGLDDLPADLRAALQAEFPEMACQDETISSPQSVTAQLGKEGGEDRGDASDDANDEACMEGEDSEGDDGSDDDSDEAEVTANEMYLMAVRGNLTCIRMLLWTGCPVDAALSGSSFGMQFMGGSTALHAACINGHLDVLEALIGAGANLNATRDDYPASDKRTALHEACKEGHTACALRLVKAGAAMHLEDAYGLTPCALAKQKGHHSLAKKLQEPPQPCDEAPKSGGRLIEIALLVAFAAWFACRILVP